MKKTCRNEDRGERKGNNVILFSKRENLTPEQKLKMYALRKLYEDSDLESMLNVLSVDELFKLTADRLYG